ncbi:hypothetical protein BH11PSE2_BH11PSE2_09800 [soil metagenome]
MKLLSNQRISAEVFLRAIAVSLVVFNHSHPVTPIKLSGGLTMLLMLSGYAFARFALQTPDPARVRKSILGFAWKLFLPSMAIVLLSFAAKREFDWRELLFISNWFGEKHIAMFFVWYPQVILQILAVLFVFFAIPGLGSTFLKRPLTGSLVALVGTMALKQVCDPHFDVAIYNGRLPILQGWNFILGMALFFALKTPAVSTRWWARALIPAAVIALVYVMWGPLLLKFWTLSFAVIFMALLPVLKMPGLIARPFFIVGEASFAVFLLHLLIIQVVGALHIHDQNLVFLLALAGSVGIWVAVTSLMRGYRRLRRAASADQGLVQVELGAA